VEAGNREQKTKLLKEIAEGRLIMALAQYEEDGSYLTESYRMEAGKEGDRFNLSAQKCS